MDDQSPGRGTFALRHVPARRGRPHQHLARGRAGLAHEVEECLRALAVAGEHPLALGVAVGGCERRGHELHAFPARAELVGEDRGQCSADALAELGLRDHDRHLVIGRDADPRSQLRFTVFCLEGPERETERQPARAERDRLEKASPGRFQLESMREHGFATIGGAEFASSRHFLVPGENRMIKPMTIEHCPVKLTADIIGGKWKPLILYFLKQAGGTMRYGELRRYMGNVSKKVLTEQIRQLESDDIVARKAHSEGNSLRVEYALTAHGNSLRPILKLMCDWGEEHRARYGDRAAGGSGVLISTLPAPKRARL